MNSQEQETFFHIGKFIYNSLNYIIVKENKPIYASKVLLKNFTCQSLEDVEKKILSKLDANQLFHHQSIKTVIKHLFDNTKLDIIKSIYKDGEYLILIDRYDSNLFFQGTSNNLISRFSFVELLKEKLFENKDNNYFLITIHIVNLKKISNIIKQTEFEFFIENLLQEIKNFLDHFLVFAEYSQDFFIAMYKDHSFEHLIQIAQNLFDHIQEFQKQFHFKVILSLYVFELKNNNFDEILRLLDSIHYQKISKKEIQNKKLHYIGKYQENMSDKEIIELLFNTSFINDTDLQLLNTYKGLIISSPTKILKKEQENIYVIAKQIQGAAMISEKKTLLISDIFNKDIECDVAFVDQKRNIAKLEHFKVVQKNEKSLTKALQVDFAKKTLARLSFVGMKLSADILYISIKNITLHVNYMKTLPQTLNKEAHITFTIPSKRTREKEITIDEIVKVSFVHCNEETKRCTLTCEFQPQSKYKNILIEYIHTRQMEIIEELKKMIY